MADLRRGVEAASEGIDKIGRGPDYSVDLARIMKSLGQVSGQLQAIQNSPSLIEVAADQYVKKFQESGTAMLSAAITVFGERSHELRGVSEKLGEQLTLAKGRYVRLKFLVLAGGGGAAIGAVAGILMALFLPRFLPASAAMTAASTVMGEDRWDAGAALMRAGDPHKWDDYMYAASVVWTNRAALSDCQDAATKAKKKQPCLFVIGGAGED